MRRRGRARRLGAAEGHPLAAMCRRRRLAAELPVLQEQAIETAQPFDPDSLYDEQGLPS